MPDDAPDLSGYTDDQLNAMIANATPNATATAAPDLSHMSDADLASAIADQQNTVSPVDVTAQKLPQQAPAAPTKDWANAPWGDVAMSGLKNLPSSVGRQVTGMVEPLLPTNWPKDVQTAYQLIKGVGSKAAGFVQNQDPAKKAQDESLINAMGADYAHRYGSVGGLKQTLATDPASYLGDAAAVASIPAGGEGIAARLPGVLGDAATTAVNVAKGVEGATNPIALAARGAQAILPKPTAMAGATLAKPVVNAVSKAFPAGTVTASDLTDPAFQATLQDVVKKKGVSPASVKEAVLQHTLGPDAQIPTSVVTGTAPPPAAANVVREAVAAGHAKLADAAANLSGAPAPSASGIGDALESAQIGAHNDYQTKYNTAFNHTGSFTPTLTEQTPAGPVQSSFSDKLNGNVADALKTLKMPSTPDEFGDFSETYQKTPAAVDFLNTYVGKLADKDALTLPNLERARQNLNTYWRNADGSDRRAMTAVIDGFDNTIQQAANSNAFTGGAATGAQVASDMADARQAFKGYKQTFESTDDPTFGAVAGAVKHLGQGQSRDAAGLITSPSDPGSAAAAQGALTSKLINPKTLEVPPAAQKLYGRLGTALGPQGQQALDDYVRQTVTKSGVTGPAGNPTLAANPNQIHAFLQSPLASVFSPEEQSQLKMMAESKRLLSAGSPSHSARQEKWMKDLAGRGARSAIATAAGSIAGAAFGGGPLAGGMGAALAGGAEQGLEKALSSREVGRSLSGAPNSGGLLYAPGRIAGALANNPPLSLNTQLTRAEGMPQAYGNEPPAQAAGGRIGRATGGRTPRTEEELVERLMKMARAAKKASNSATEPLLNVSDDTVAKALNVAQQAI